ncbi:sequence-specific DNA binding, partial [Halocaridina rubra]
ASEGNVSSPEPIQTTLGESPPGSPSNSNSQYSQPTTESPGSELPSLASIFANNPTQPPTEPLPSIIPYLQRASLYSDFLKSSGSPFSQAEHLSEPGENRHRLPSLSADFLNSARQHPQEIPPLTYPFHNYNNPFINPLSSSEVQTSNSDHSITSPQPATSSPKRFERSPVSRSSPDSHRYKYAFVTPKPSSRLLPLDLVKEQSSSPISRLQDLPESSPPGSEPLQSSAGFYHSLSRFHDPPEPSSSVLNLSLSRIQDTSQFPTSGLNLSKFEDSSKFSPSSLDLSRLQEPLQPSTSGLHCDNRNSAFKRPHPFEEEDALATGLSHEELRRLYGKRFGAIPKNLPALLSTAEVPEIEPQALEPKTEVAESWRTNMAENSQEKMLGVSGDPDKQSLLDNLEPTSLFTRCLVSAVNRRTRGEKKPIPDTQKDEKYFERRKRNNLAAKKSRDNRKQREDQVALRACHLEKENAVLRAQVAALREEANHLRLILVRGRPNLLNTVQMIHESCKYQLPPSN